MKIDIRNYNLISKRFLGTDLHLLFQSLRNSEEKKILKLFNVVGFFDLSEKSDLKVLRVDEEGGSYAQDLSMRLSLAEIKSYKEIFLFTDLDCVNFKFRAVAENVEFRSWIENDKWF